MENKLWVEKLLKTIAEKAAKCTTPNRYLIKKWIEIFKKNHDDCATLASTLYTYVYLKMNNIEEIAYLGTHQKVQMLFVMSKKVSEKFEEILLQQGFEFELDDKRKFKHVRSNDGKLQLTANTASGISSPARSDDSSIPTEQKPDELDALEDNGVKREEPLVYEYIPNPNNIKQEQLDMEYESEELEYEKQKAEQLRVDHRRIVHENLERIRRAREVEEARLEREKERREALAKAQIRTVEGDNRSTGMKRLQDPMPTEAKRSRPNEEGRATRSSSISSIFTLEPRAKSTVSLPRIPDDSTSRRTISALKVAQQFEAMIACCGLEDLEQMASQMVQSLSKNDKTIQASIFHQNFVGMLALTADEKLTTFEGECMKLKVFYKSLKLSVIRPLGVTVNKSLELVEKKIENLEDTNDEGVVPMGTIRDNLETFLLSVTGF